MDLFSRFAAPLWRIPPMSGAADYAIRALKRTNGYSALQPKYIKNGGVGLILEFRVVFDPMFRRWAAARSNRDILPAIGLKRHRWCRKTRAEVDRPKFIEHAVV